MARKHQVDEDKFRTILPEEVPWGPFPAFPKGALLAVVVGHPAEPGPYLVRVKVPGGTKLMPHKHPEDRIYTVISGVFYIGLGETFDGDKVRAYPPGSIIVLPGETWHFHWAKSGEYVTQVSAIGPLGLEYYDPRNDPRAEAAASAPSEKDRIEHRSDSDTPDTRTMQVHKEGGAPGLARRHADRVKQYIEQNLDGAIRVSELAAIVRLSSGHFSKAFKATFGQSPLTYILSRRVARVKELMMDSETPLSFIAIDCGFSDQAHMSRRFRRAVGASPGVWRRERPAQVGMSASISTFPHRLPRLDLHREYRT